MRCCICNRTLDSRFTNNASPYKEGVCCDACNRMYVIPYRLKQMKELDLNRIEWQTKEV